MIELAYALSSEEHDARTLIEIARRAEAAGFRSVWISDHYHPWIDRQGHSPFVWSVIGGIAATTDLTVTTGVTCPTVRIHPAVIAQATATSSNLLPGGRFRFGVGSGEALNEHVLGDRWPPADVRLDMLAEAIGVIRELWTGESVSGVPGQLRQDLPTPAHFEEAIQPVTEEAATEGTPCGPDPERYVAAVREFVDAGFDEVAVTQIGPDQEGFFRFYERELRGRLAA